MIKDSKREIVEDFHGRVDDIVDTILAADLEAAQYTKMLARQLDSGTSMSTFRNIWHWVRENIDYIPDSGTERVKSPGATYKDGYGDCKSMALFVGSILQNLGYDYYYRIAFYDENQPNAGHIYVIAKSRDGREVAIDAVLDEFNKQYKWWRKMDKTRIQYIRGVNGPRPRTSPADRRRPSYPGSTTIDNPDFSPPTQTGADSGNNNFLYLVAVGLAAYYLLK